MISLVQQPRCPRAVCNGSEFAQSWLSVIVVVFIAVATVASALIASSEVRSAQIGLTSWPPARHLRGPPPFCADLQRSADLRTRGWLDGLTLTRSRVAAFSAREARNKRSASPQEDIFVAISCPCGGCYLAIMRRMSRLCVLALVHLFNCGTANSVENSESEAQNLVCIFLRFFTGTAYLSLSLGKRR
jgi:hypothetical protein